MNDRKVLGHSSQVTTVSVNPRHKCGGVRSLHTEIKHLMKVGTIGEPGATCVADKSDQSCPFHHLTSNKITSINNLSYEGLDLSASKVQDVVWEEGCSIFSMIKAEPNCVDNIKDLAGAGCVRAVLGTDRGCTVDTGD